MKYDLIARAAQLLRRGGRHRRWRRAVSGLAAVVVFVTSYMLILPALTLEQDTICGLEEHTHTDACYEQRLVCTLEESEPVYEDQQVLTCTLPEGEGHAHTEACYGLTCALEESAGHTHTEACCTAVSELTCTLAESEGHAHSDSCYGEDGSLICTLEESEGHTHADGCYTTVSQLTCTQAESAGHTHADGCCGLICGQEESEAHTHTDACYTTEQVQVSGHVHTDACYEQVLICDLPEHTHDESCYPAQEGELICEMAEHTHTQDCYDEDGSLICDLPEHTHTEDCYAVEIPEEDVPMAAFPEVIPKGYEEYSFDNGSGLVVTAYAPEGAFGQDVQLFAEVLSEDSEEYAQAKENLDKAENAPEYTGMAAMDIRFVDAAAEDPAAAEEIEPDASMGQVYVDIQAQALIPEDADTSTLAVQHHVETESDKIFGLIPNVFDPTVTTVETVADSSDTTGTVTAAPAAVQTLDLTEEDSAPAAQDVEAQFAVESFSTFTITWNANAHNSKAFDVTSYLWQNNEPTVTPISGPRDLQIGTSNEFIFTADNPLLHVDGYTLVKGQIKTARNAQWQDIYSFKAVVRDWNSGGWSYYYKTTSNSSDSWINIYNNSNYPAFRLYYKQEIAQATGWMSIQDNISEDGSLTVVFNNDQWEGGGDAPNAAEDGYYYKWYRQDPDGGAYTQVTGAGSTTDTLPVYLDGARATYYVELWVLNGTSAIATSYPYQVPYYSQVQNGGFEDVEVPSGNNLQFTNGLFPEMVWQTTGLDKEGNEFTGQDLEIIKASANGAWGNYGVTDDDETNGDQLAELNCEAAGALYQDVLTIPGQDLYWWASHRARDGGGENTQKQDHMYVVIMSTEDAQHVTSQKDIDTLIDRAGRRHMKLLEELDKDNPVYTDEGTTVTDVSINGYSMDATIWRVESNAASWHRYGGTYQVPEGQYLTRFFFSSGKNDENASGNNTVGNLLDRVGFDQNPPTSENAAGLTIQKTVSGLAPGTVISAETFTFTVSNNTVVKLPTSSVTVGAEGTATFTSSSIILTEGVYTVAEARPDGLDGYTYVSTTANGKKGSLETGEFSLTNGESKTVPFVNTYEPNTGDLAITKKVSYTGKDDYESTAVFTFEVSLSGETLSGSYDLAYQYQGGKGHDDYTWPSGITSDPPQAPVSEGKLTVYIPAEATVTIKGLPVGKQVVIEEINYSGYAPAWSGDVATPTPGASTTTNAITADTPIAVTCTNTTGAVLPSTGGMGVVPYFTLGSLMTIGGGLLLIRRRWKGGHAAR